MTYSITHHTLNTKARITYQKVHLTYCAMAQLVRYPVSKPGLNEVGSIWWARTPPWGSSFKALFTMKQSSVVEFSRTDVYTMMAYILFSDMISSL